MRSVCWHIWFLTFIAPAYSGDWPQLLGPNRNGVSFETSLAKTWPKDGPRIAWTMKVGQGWSGPLVSSNRAILFHRVGASEIVDCLNATNGHALWKAEYPTQYRDDFGFDEGPRATPAIDAERVFTFGAEGMLHAWNFASGKKLWSVDTTKQLGATVDFFGVACSPLVEGNAVILNLGGRNGAGIAAFNKSDGKLLWKATDERASHSSPTAATIKGKRYAFVFTRSALVALDPASGRVFWKFPWQPSIRASVSAATPLVTDDSVFISASYGAGAALLRFNESAPEKIWSGDDVLSNHYATSVEHSGYLYGFDGRQEQSCSLRCVELKTGKVRWSEEGFGAGTLLIVNASLLILTEKGELMMATASPQRFQPLNRAQILGADCRAYPAFAGGMFYARDKRTLVCLDLRSQ